MFKTTRNLVPPRRSISWRLRLLLSAAGFLASLAEWIGTEAPQETPSKKARRANQSRDLVCNAVVLARRNYTKRLCRNGNFAYCLNVIAPAASSGRKISLSFFQNTCLSSTHPASTRGAYARSSRDARRAGGGRVGLQRGFGCADEQSRCGREVAWSWPPDAEVKPERDARASAQAMGAIKPVPRESAKEALKPSRREGWAHPAAPVVPAPCTFVRTGAMGVSRRPAFPAPSIE